MRVCVCVSVWVVWVWVHVNMCMCLISYLTSADCWPIGIRYSIYEPFQWACMCATSSSYTHYSYIHSIFRMFLVVHVFRISLFSPTFHFRFHISLVRFCCCRCCCWFYLRFYSIMSVCLHLRRIFCGVDLLPCQWVRTFLNRNMILIHMPVLIFHFNELLSLTIPFSLLVYGMEWKYRYVSSGKNFFRSILKTDSFNMELSDFGV